MQKVRNPVPIFLSASGTLLDSGEIYVGVAGGDPQTNPINTFFDVELTIPSAQPIRTLGGLIVNGVTPAQIFVAEADYSMRILDAFGQLIAYSPSVYTDTSSFQPADADLTAIATQGTTAYGRALMLLPNQEALQEAVGTPNALPTAGGTMTGNITRQGGGVYPYFADPAITGGRIFITAAGAGDPTSQPGDLWYVY